MILKDDILMDRSKSLIKNTLILGVGTIFSKCLVFIMIPFFSRWLSTNDYGTFDLYTTYISLMIPILTLACGEAVFRYLIDGDDEEKKSITAAGNLIVTVGSIIGSIAVAVIWIVTGQNYMLPFICCLIAEVLNNYLQAFLRGIKRLDVYAISNVICMFLIAIFVTINVRFLNLGLAGMLYGYAFAYIINDLYMAMWGKIWRYSDFHKLSRKYIKDIIVFSIPLIPNSIAWWIVNASDRVIISEQIGNVYNGIYAIANKMPQICTVMFSVFQVSWNQNASEAINDKDRNEYFSKVLNNMIKIVTSICVCVLACNFIVFDYIMDEKYYSAYYQVPVLVAATIFTVISQYFGGIFIGLKNPKVNGGTTIVAAFINVLLNVIAIRYFGLYAASFSTLVAFMVLCAIRWMYMKKDIKISIKFSTLGYAVMFIYFSVIVYVNNKVLNWVNVLVAAVIFIYTNRKFIKRMVGKVLKRV